MKTYTGKVLEDVLAAASQDQGCTVEDLNYQVTEEKKGFFSKKIEINVFVLTDIIEYSQEYLKKIVNDYGLEVTFNTTIDEGVIRISLDTNHNSILIGKNGRTLQALNDMVRHATAQVFQKRYRILLDINAYKDEKYDKLIHIAKRVAKDVQRTKINATLDPMTSDERRIVHNALGEFHNIRTESSGQGHKRQITIFYVEDK